MTITAAPPKLTQLRAELQTIAMGSSPRDQLTISRMFLHAHMRNGGAKALFSRVPSLPDPPRQVSLRSGQRVMARRADGIVLFEHFGLDVYGIDLGLRDPQVIVDLGANIGFSTIALARRYPTARFVCVEPTAENRALLEKNLALNGIDARVFPYAIVGASGRYDLNVGEYPAANNVSPSAAGSIEGITFGELLDRAGVETVDLLKIDIEGAERQVFEAAAGWAGRVGAIVGELHDGLTSDQVATWLAPYGLKPLPAGAATGDLSLAAFARS
jgi:FkbM family methyltransferase